VKFKNIGTTGNVEFNDLGAVIKGVSPIDRKVTLKVGDSVYIPDTGDVLFSSQAGDGHRFAKAGLVAVNDTVTLANAATFVIAHNFNFVPKVVVAYDNAGTWVDAAFMTGKVTAVTNAALTETTITNVSGGALTLLIRIS